MMKKLLTTTILLILPAVVLAQEVAPDVDLMVALETLTNWLFTLLLVVAVVFLIIAAFTFITASGDPSKVEKARNFVFYALIGVAVAVAARGLVALVQTIMGA